MKQADGPAPSNASRFELQQMVPADQDKSKLGRMTNINNTLPKGRIRELNPRTPGGHNRRDQAEKPKSLVDKRADELQAILNNISAMRQKKVGSKTNLMSMEKLERRVNNVQMDDGLGDGPSYGPLMGMTLKEHISAQQAIVNAGPTRPHRVATSLGRDTFDERKVDLQLYQLDHKKTEFQKSVTREKRNRLLERRLEGAAVGKYTPKDTMTRQSAPAIDLAAGVKFMTAQEKAKEIEERKIEAQLRRTQWERMHPGQEMPAEYETIDCNFKEAPPRPDPFKVNKQWTPKQKDCSKCEVRDVHLKMEPSWHTQQRFANWPFGKSDTVEFSKVSARKEIIEGFYTAHEGRFVKSQCSKIKADERNVYTVKLNKFSGRDPKQQFWVPATEPKPSEGKDVSHGGVFYDRSYYEKVAYNQRMKRCLPFTRSVRNKQEMLTKIERVTKTAKVDTKPKSAGARRRQCAREDVQFLINLMKPQQADRPATRA